jgi:hypothetical protein
MDQVVWRTHSGFLWTRNIVHIALAYSGRQAKYNATSYVLSARLGNNKTQNQQEKDEKEKTKQNKKLPSPI